MCPFTGVERGTQSDIFSNIIINKMRSMHLIYRFGCKMIFEPLVRFGLSILGTKMAAILDLVNMAWTYVAELYFIGFVDPQNISLGTKTIFLAGLEIEISQKLDLVTGHGGHFEKRIFFSLFGHF